MVISKKAIGLSEKNGVYYIDTDGPCFKLVFLNAYIVRIRCSFDRSFKEESYSLVMTAWEDRLDEFFGDERKRIDPFIPNKFETGDQIIFCTGEITVIIDKEPFGIDIVDANRQILYSDIRDLAYLKDSQGCVRHYSRISETDCFYGFGEKTGAINKFRKRMVMCNKDAIGYDAEFSDPLYKHIPFYIKLSREYKTACGVFYNNSYESVFDMGCERSGYWPRYSYFSAKGGDIDLFFIYGPSIREVVERYTDLTGKNVLLPIYALGYLGSTMYYTELPEKCDDEITGFIEKAEAENIPCDGFQLSSGYTTGKDNKRYVLTWNKERFAEPEAFFERMNRNGVTVSPNVKPGMLLTHPLYEEFENCGAFIKTKNGKKPYTGRYWGGTGSFVDFSNPKGREVWKKYLKKELIGLGTTSIWNDNCEFEIDEEQTKCDFEGETADTGQMKAVLPNLMAMAAHEAIKENYPDIRPFVINRSGFSGIQRYSQTWAGDNTTCWKTLKYNIATVLGMGLSGVANHGCDIGGFYGPAPEAELFVRWVQNGIFHPRFSIHSCNTDNTVTEPWMYSSFTQYIRDAIRLRYRLIPYFYSLMYEAHRIGSPIMRAMVYEFQDDMSCYEESFDFMVGSSLLVACVLEKGQTSRRVYLPKGCSWYDWYSRERYEGGQTVEVNAPLDIIPMFFRSDSIIPITDNISNLHRQSIEKLTIIIEPWQDCNFLLYEDDGLTNNNCKGQYCETSITVTRTQDKVAVSFKKNGEYRSELKEIILDVICADKGPFSASISGGMLKQYLHADKWQKAAEGWYYDHESNSAKIKYTCIQGDYNVEVNYAPFDLIGM